MDKKWKAKANRGLSGGHLNWCVALGGLEVFVSWDYGYSWANTRGTESNVKNTGDYRILLCFCDRNSRGLTSYREKCRDCVYMFSILGPWPCLIHLFLHSVVFARLFSHLRLLWLTYCHSLWVRLWGCECFYVQCVCMRSPVTMTVRMWAWRRSCRTPGVSAFSLFCMMIRPRKSMLVSMWSLFQMKTQTH